MSGFFMRIHSLQREKEEEEEKWNKEAKRII